MNFQGDRPSVNNGTLPTALFNIYDNLTFRCKIGGLTYDGDYTLTVTYMDRRNPASAEHKITANGKTVYCGPQFGGESDPDYDREMLRPGFVSASYTLPHDFIENGCVDLELSEPTMGVMFLSSFYVVNIQQSLVTVFVNIHKIFRALQLNL